MSIRSADRTGSTGPRTASLIVGRVARALPSQTTHAGGRGYQRELGKNATATQLQFERRPDGGTGNDRISSVTVY